MMSFNAQLEKYKRKQLNLQNLKWKNLPQDLTDAEELYQYPEDDIVFKDFVVSTDSGAHSLYKEHFVVGDKISSQARLNADYSYIKTKEFKKFLDNYIAHCHEFKDLYKFYVTLDIINNPEESWRIMEYIESCGLLPMPVFHNGEDIHWLERMVEKYPYIGISGLGQDIVKAKFKPFGDACFKVICDKHGKPKCKVHGFAMGAPEIIKMYPWYSADQSTWTYMARVGSLLVPKPIINGTELVDYDYLNMYKVIPVTRRRDVEPHYIDNLSETARFYVQHYLDINKISVDAIKDSYHWRDVANIRLFNNIQLHAKQWYKERFDYEEGGNIYFAGTASGAGTNRSRLIRLMHDIKIDNINWLVTPVYQQHAENVRILAQTWLNGQCWKEHWDEKQASKARKSTVFVKNVIDKPKVIRKPLIINRPPIELELTVTYTVKDIVDISKYGVMPLTAVAQSIVKELSQHHIEPYLMQEPSVKAVLKLNNEQVYADNTTKLPPKNGFF